MSRKTLTPSEPRDAAQRGLRRSGNAGQATLSEAPFGCWPEGVLDRESFIDLVWEQGDQLYRDLPWRGIDDPYAVLVSEIMLQQTQVARVERFWRRFLSSFPTIDALASASTSDVLEHWQGLGYNRRALALKRAADICSSEFGGQLPLDYDGLLALPGVGPATAAGVMAFAYRKPAVYIETNVRSVFIHHLFPEVEKVSDKILSPCVESCCPGEGAAPDRDVRAWYYALLDYGSHLKATGENPSRKSAHYAKQSTFEGSRRQKRAWIVRRVLAEPEGVEPGRVLAELSAHELSCGREAVDDAMFASIVENLLDEGFFRRAGSLLVP